MDQLGTFSLSLVERLKLRSSTFEIVLDLKLCA